MKERFKSALDGIEADEALVSKTEARLRNELTQGRHSRTKSMKGSMYNMKKFAIVACMALLLIGSGFAYATPTSYLSVDINPSVELGINTFGIVVSAEALNEDGEDILSGIDVTGIKVKKAVNIIVDAAADKGFLKDDGSSFVSLTAATDDKEKADKLTRDAEEGTEDALAENEIAAEVGQAAISHARRDAAREAGISPGKMNLIQKLWEATENDGDAAIEEDLEAIFDFADEEFGDSNKTYAESSVKDIMKAIKDARIDAADEDASAEDDADEPGIGKANAPGQLKKAAIDDDDQDLTLPNGSGKANAPGQLNKVTGDINDQNSITLPNGKIKNIAPDENDDEE
jgi:hypothetical protein